MVEYGFILGIPNQTDNAHYRFSLGVIFIRHDGTPTTPSNGGRVKTIGTGKITSIGDGKIDIY